MPTKAEKIKQLKDTQRQAAAAVSSGREITELRTISSKTFASGATRVTQFKARPIHYKEAPSNPFEIWKDVDLEHRLDMGDHWVYDKMHVIVKVAKDESWYEVDDRGTDEKIEVRIPKENGNADNIRTQVQIKPRRVEFWIEADADREVEVSVKKHGSGKFKFTEADNAIDKDGNEKVLNPKTKGQKRKVGKAEEYEYTIPLKQGDRVDPTTDTYTADDTWTAPAGVSSVTVEAWGGGGAAPNSNDVGGGGGGAYAASTVAVTPATGYSFTVGIGGVYSGTLALRSGTNSTFVGDDKTVDADAGSYPNPSSTPGQGGLASASTGDVKYDGGNGGIEMGGGGGAGGPDGAGVTGDDGYGFNLGGDGGDGNNGLGGAGGTGAGGGGQDGGSNPLGGGGGGAAELNSGYGGDGGDPGGGAGGSDITPTNVLGHGGDGQISITYTITIPQITTDAVTSLAHTSFTANGNITNEGTASPTRRGFVYDTSSHAHPGNVSPASSSYASVEDETGTFSTGAFSLGITGLTAETTYYIRAFAENTNGYGYGDEIVVTTKHTPPVLTAVEDAGEVDLSWTY